MIFVWQGDMVDDEAVLLKDVLDCQLVELKGKTWGLSFQVTTTDPSGHPRCVDLTTRTMPSNTSGTAPPTSNPGIFYRLNISRVLLCGTVVQSKILLHGFEGGECTLG